VTDSLFLNDPEYFHRDYNNDLPQKSDGNFFSQALALPFMF